MRQRGFTLIEIMVVVAVIAVVSVAIATTFGRSTDRYAKLEVKRFMAVVNEVRDEAVIAGDAYALLVDVKDRSYSFLPTRTGAQMIDDGLFRPRSMREDVDLDWQVYDVIDQKEGGDAKVLITSLGEITPFELTVSGDKHEYIVFVNDEGLLEQRVRDSVFRP
jgi:general secretion pathway protein H